MSRQRGLPAHLQAVQCRTEAHLSVTDTSAPKPWLAGADPLLGSTDGTLTELRTGRLGAAGGNKNEGGGG